MDNAHAPVAGTSRRNRWSKEGIKWVLVIVVVALVTRYQVIRPKTPHIYYTSHAFDNSRNGITYTCGCSLPVVMQVQPQTPTNESTSEPEQNSTLKNRCLDRSTTENVNVLMYPNVTVVGNRKFTQEGILDGILQDAYGTTFTKNKETSIVQGYHGVKRAHDVSWHGSAFLEGLSDIYLTGNAKQRQLKVPVEFLMNLPPQSDGQSGLQSGPQYSPFLEFPRSYINLAFAFNCTNSECSYEKVNQMFTRISGDSTWGSCALWWNKDNKCGNATESDNWCTSKCVLYPSEALPINYAISDFFDALTAVLSRPADIFTPEDLANKTGTQVLLWHERAFASFSANVLHMEFNKTANEDIQLNFFELEKHSAAWLTILNAYPTLDTECSALKTVEISEGTSLCNVFSNAKAEKFERRCIQMTDKRECEKKYLHKNNPNVNVFVDADETLWEASNVTRGNWPDLLCLTYANKSVPPYKVLWKTAKEMQNNSLNQFLESKIWSYDWARASGVCTNSYNNVTRQPIVTQNNSTVTAFMETKCNDVGGYCWLTGQYRLLNDTPDDDWHNISVFDPDDLFVCYAFTKQNVWIWLIVGCGILFGWLGTVDLVCKWLVFPFSRLLARLIWKNVNRLLIRTRPGVNVVVATDSASVPRPSGELEAVIVIRPLYLTQL